MGHLCGIDLGTTGVRAALFDASGVMLAESNLSCPYTSREPGWAEVREDRWWHATLSVLADLASRTSSKLSDVDAIGVVGQAPTVALTDGDGTMLAPALLWLDTRATTEEKELGIPSYYLGPKLLWLSRHEPALSRAKWILQSHALIAMRLTGVAATDPSTAALARPLFNLEARTWDPSGCERLGVRPDQLPPIRPAHEVIGHVTAGAARAIGHGLRADTPVVAGGGDFAAATLSAGVLEEGAACLMLGTAGNLLVPRKTPGKDARLIHAHHVGVDTWLSLGGTLSGGAQEWLRLAVSRGSTDEQTAVRSALPAFEQLDLEAKEIQPGSDALLFLPYLRGERTPIWNANARGAFIGLATEHQRGHLWRAVLEGIALGFVDCQEVLEQDGVRLSEVIAANGGGKSPLFRQILCDALGVPLSYTPQSGGTVAGAAMLAGLGTKVLTESDLRAWRGSSIRHTPDRGAHARYRELLTLRREAYQGLAPIFDRLVRLR